MNPCGHATFAPRCQVCRLVERARSLNKPRVSIAGLAEKNRH